MVITVWAVEDAAMAISVQTADRVSAVGYVSIVVGTLVGLGAAFDVFSQWAAIGSATMIACGTLATFWASGVRNAAHDQKVAWRKLTAKQATALKGSLQGHDFPIWVTTVGDDPEACLYHKEMFDALGAAGLKTQWFTGYAMAVGVTLTTTDRPEVRAMLAALKAAGIPVGPKSGDGMKGDVIELTVGSKPEA
ncbi:MAG: hypothetical protein Q8R45_09180 [Brevundimonas sp.]|uniref:hypothetical protein n=1 Tax=Brevundimonas sp. TaxID=1871086 RepID=UPI0027348168|nr:hypothetical protein [Brevundimonas sp.]MDP3657121.1 hypothetical protein [Brevundimonas sp.]MDZ4111079.1 hypothetical protein [Brevundimonas sp.]